MKAKPSFPTHVVVSCKRNAHFQTREVQDFEPKAAPGTPQGPPRHPKEAKGTRIFVSKLPIKRPSGRYVIANIRAPQTSRRDGVKMQQPRLLHLRRFDETMQKLCKNKKQCNNKHATNYGKQTMQQKQLYETTIQHMFVFTTEDVPPHLSACG